MQETSHMFSFVGFCHWTWLLRHVYAHCRQFIPFETVLHVETIAHELGNNYNVRFSIR